ncbi:uncharacterized protein VDAG_03840 [Verticillium dahliae VdLs.17]|uniref:Uncharacterized protein n=1 Tax=Verticillium dahliae (strain VdLs.17 / ATCC MYA-4575 / FGSC 10137) TaxID=498257 RepID=G2X0R1_VERDV|nr:uncharacterized protein VDAG_03840 [Verticillium dahliae VdLs.17]EGY22402.1 hypothetical protein VDAG_03840 [Verticillium dahliae VdLs.17]
MSRMMDGIDVLGRIPSVVSENSDDPDKLEDSKLYDESTETAGIGEERLGDMFEVGATERLGGNSDCVEGIGILMEAGSVGTFIELTAEPERLKVNEADSGCTEGLARAKLVAGAEKPDEDPEESLASLDVS